MFKLFQLKNEYERKHLLNSMYIYISNIVFSILLLE